MGILNRTPDSFYDRGATFALDDLLRRAEVLVAEGADLLDVGGVKAGPGPEVGEAEELDRVIPSIEALHARFRVAISCDTWRASVLDEACKAGAVVGNDISGFADPDYLPTCRDAGAAVVATHIRLKPRVPDPDPHYDDVVTTVCEFLRDRAQQAEALAQGPHRRHDALELLGLGDLRAGSGLHTAHVQQVGSGRDVALRQAEERVHVPVRPLVEERVGRAVEDAHHQRARREVVDATPEVEQHRHRRRR